MADRIIQMKDNQGNNLFPLVKISPSILEGNYLPITGGTLTGDLILKGDPTSLLMPATKQYVDNKFDNYLPLSGGTLTGLLICKQGLFVNTNTNSTPLYISRYGGNGKCVAHGVDDSIYTIHYTNNEISSAIRFRFTNTDTESGGGANASDRIARLTSTLSFYPEVNNSGSIGTNGNQWQSSYLSNALYLNNSTSYLISQAAIGSTYYSTDKSYSLVMPTATETARAVALCSTSASSDYGMFYLSCDTAFVINSGDAGGYVFRVLDKDMIKAANANDDTCMCMGVKQSGAGTAFKGTVSADKVTGAVWNDYAEYRKSDDNEPGHVVMEDKKGVLQRATERLQSFAGVVSDTFGFAQGETDEAKTPLAVSGRVLVYPYRPKEEYSPGDCVCAAPDGTVDIMTRQEIRDWPDRIVGTVSEIPDYETWGTGNVEVNGRIWIKVR